MGGDIVHFVCSVVENVIRYQNLNKWEEIENEIKNSVSEVVMTVSFISLLDQVSSCDNVDVENIKEWLENDGVTDDYEQRDC